MPLEWTHSAKHVGPCLGEGNTNCPAFPTMIDRIAMATAVYDEYAEADGTHFLDFIQDVMLTALDRGVEPDTIALILSRARTQYHREKVEESNAASKKRHSRKDRKAK